MSRTGHHTPVAGKGNFSLAYHLEMLADRERVTQFKRGIDAVVTEDTVFCELGCGTGVFSIYAAQRAKKVYAVEYDEKVFQVAKKNIENAGCDNIELIAGDALQVTLLEKVHVIFCEMLSIWMIDEPQIPVMNRAVAQLLKHGGRTIPEAVTNLVELGDQNYEFDGVTLRTPIAQFTGIKSPRIMTESRIIRRFELNQQNPMIIDEKAIFKTLASGTINCARLTSIVQVVPGVVFYSTDTLMPQTIVPLETDVKVDCGQSITLTLQYEHNRGFDGLQLVAT